MTVSRAFRLSALLALLLTCAAALGAQESAGGVRIIVRADWFHARTDALHLAVGLTTDLGSYVRLDGVVGAGTASGPGSRTVASGRAEVVARFLLDPFRQSRWGFYGAGGLIARMDGDDDPRGQLTLLFGAELPARGRMAPALELGIGGGVRLGAVLRRGRLNRR